MENTYTLTKPELRKQMEKQLAEFLARGGQVQVVEPKKPKSGARTWKRS